MDVLCCPRCGSPAGAARVCRCGATIPRFALDVCDGMRDLAWVGDGGTRTGAGLDRETVAEAFRALLRRVADGSLEPVDCVGRLERMREIVAAHADAMDRFVADVVRYADGRGDEAQSAAREYDARVRRHLAATTVHFEAAFEHATASVVSGQEDLSSVLAAVDAAMDEVEGVDRATLDVRAAVEV